MNQILEIKNHLEKRGYITSMQAIELFGVTRLSSVIYVLRNKYNMNIETERRETINRYGNTVHYGFYKLKEDEKDE